MKCREDAHTHRHKSNRATRITTYLSVLALSVNGLIPSSEDRHWQTGLESKPDNLLPIRNASH
jgi:hypothetical protein